MSHNNGCGGAPTRNADGSWCCAVCGQPGTFADVAYAVKIYVDRLDVDVFNLLGRPSGLDEWSVDAYDDSMTVEISDDSWVPDDDCLTRLLLAGFRRLWVIYVRADGSSSSPGCYHLTEGTYT